MIAVAIDDQSPVPPFEQLRVQLSALIMNGTVAAHSKLPTVRQLAGDLGLAKNTVSRTYAALERDGLVTGDRRLGTTVIERQPPTDDDRNRMFIAATRRYLDELAQLGATRADAITTLRHLIANA